MKLLPFKVYISGPISRGRLADNINQATYAFQRLQKAGLAPLCPQWSCFAEGCVEETYDGYDEVTNQRYDIVKTTAEAKVSPFGTTGDDWMRVDIPWVLASDMVLRLPGESAGADTEEAAAKSKDIPVFYDIEALVKYARQRTYAYLEDSKQLIDVYS